MRQTVRKGQIRAVERIFTVKSLSRGNKVSSKNKHVVPASRGSPESSKKRERAIDLLDKDLIDKGLLRRDLSEIPRPKRPRIGKGSNEYLREWKDNACENYLHTLVELESPPENRNCLLCNKPALYRCFHCFNGQRLLCFGCCVNQHQYLPFHSIAKWTGSFFDRCDLGDLGLIIHLGHDGACCPSLMGFDEHVNEEEIDDQDSDAQAWVDEEIDKAASEAAGFKRGNELVFVADSGVYRRSVQRCVCPNAPETHIQLLQMRFFPATLQRPSTAFTFNVLDQFHMEAMECKTSALNFFSKLRRMTNSAFPFSVPDRYRELMRVSRKWRYLQSLKRAGFAHHPRKEKEDGDLVLFCPTCPQPGINVPWEEVELSSTPSLYQPSIVGDGNFKLEHVIQKFPEEDVFLSDGRGFFVATQKYQEHISVSVEYNQKVKCHKHRAISQANGHSGSRRDHLRATGVGACACARHGCFYPHSVVDFQKGERQMNMDYSVCEAFSRVKAVKKVLYIYDIGCEWCQNFLHRVHASRHLRLRPDLEVVTAVGKFHLGAHIRACFPLFSLNFVRGAGQLDGEILETLWSSLNKVAGNTRGMSQAHRQEVLDNHMNDSNWKKLINSPKSIAKKWEKALQEREVTKLAFEEMTDRIDDNWLTEWKKLEENAMEKRGELLRIYDVADNKDPDCAEILYELSQKERKAGDLSGISSLLATGLDLEDAQASLSSYCKSLKQPSNSEKAEVEDRRRRLQIQISKYEKKCASLTVFSGEGIELEERKVSTNIWEDDGDAVNPESMTLFLPSNIFHQDQHRHGLESMMQIEAKLRAGQINEALQQLRIALGEKSLIYREKVQNSRSQRTSTRAWSQVNQMQSRVQHAVQYYKRARAALERLNAADPRFKDITAEDLKMPGDVIEENRIGQRSDTLSWFWRLDSRLEGQERGERMKEFYRVNWLRASARFERWSEEVILLQHEMVWTVGFFKYKKEEWKKIALETENPNNGLSCYAAKEANTWANFERYAETLFRSVTQHEHL